MSKELINVPVYGRVIVSSNGRMIVKNNTDYYIILGHDNEGDQIIVFEKEKVVAKFPSLMYLFASLADTKHVSEEDTKLLLNIIKKHW